MLTKGTKERGAISLEAIGFVLKNGFFKKPPAALMEDLLLIVDIGKTMPSFNDLDLSDKICLLTQITMPLSILLLAYYSYTKKYNAVIMPTGSGLSMALGFSGEYYKGDKTIAKLSKKVFIDSMEPFTQVQLTEEEYVLLRAIIFCHSFTDGLSKQGKELLLNESEKYSKILMKILQNRHGDLAGARRFTECVQLIQACFFFGHQHSLFFNYLANVYHRDTFRNVMPEAFVNLCLRKTMSCL
uniref:NR LBD domain-containing protein n=2 Tax=Meloidogyne incognita group TaxID=654580 RepID=A0A915LHE8_MELJA